MIGGGQLGQMFCLAASSLGYKTCVIDPQQNCPASSVASEFIKADYDDKNALDMMIKKCYAITIEFENIPLKAAEYLNQKTIFYPPPLALEICQNRILEKNFLKNNQILTADFLSIQNENDLKNIDNFIYPAILKTAKLGYDGKGQVICHNAKEASEAFYNLKQQQCILEKKINLQKEVSQIVAINKDKQKYHLPIAENIHINGILSKSTAPAKIDNNTKKEIEKITAKIAINLNYQGILSIEFFIDENNNVMVNELAPRTHNSGHYSMDGCLSSQFDQQVRVMADLPFGNSLLLFKTEMTNILGDDYKNGELDIKKILSDDKNKLHLYGKTEDRIGRKMGHINHCYINI